MDGVRNWRLRKAERTTHVVQPVANDLTARVVALEEALAVAGQALSAAHLDLVDLKQRFTVIEQAMQALAAEAERRLRAA